MTECCHARACVWVRVLAFVLSALLMTALLPTLSTRVLGFVSALIVAFVFAKWLVINNRWVHCFVVSLVSVYVVLLERGITEMLATGQWVFHMDNIVKLFYAATFMLMPFAFFILIGWLLYVAFDHIAAKKCAK